MDCTVVSSLYYCSLWGKFIAKKGGQKTPTMKGYPERDNARGVLMGIRKKDGTTLVNHIDLIALHQAFLDRKHKCMLQVYHAEYTREWQNRPLLSVALDEMYKTGVTPTQVEKAIRTIHAQETDDDMVVGNSGWNIKIIEKEGMDLTGWGSEITHWLEKNVVEGDFVMVSGLWRLFVGKSNTMFEGAMHLSVRKVLEQDETSFDLRMESNLATLPLTTILKRHVCATAEPDLRPVIQEEIFRCMKKRRVDRNPAYKNDCMPWIVMGFWGHPDTGKNVLQHNNSYVGTNPHWESLSRFYEPTEGICDNILSFGCKYKDLVHPTTPEHKEMISKVREVHKPRDRAMLLQWRQNMKKWKEDHEAERAASIPYIALHVYPNFESKTFTYYPCAWERTVLSNAPRQGTTTNIASTIHTVFE